MRKTLTRARTSISIALLLAGSLAALLTPATEARTQSRNTTEFEFFEKRVRPLLAEQCYSCHSAASKQLMGGLRLDTKAATLKGGEHGLAVVPGKPGQSSLIRAIRYTDKTLQMPPKGRMTDAQIAVLTEWVKMGAPDSRTSGPAPAKTMGMSVEAGRKLWAYQPLKHTDPPATQRPVVPTTQVFRTPIDKFVLAKLAPKGMTPNPAANRQTLIRRATFDLIGLPPTPEEIADFVNDRSPNAWEKVIDRLLASPHYGERWGRHWLDLARFAESHGYEQDYDRPNAYHYRDFVIRALNMDLPYDSFVKWQLAGDEFEPGNPLALMATGFLGAGTHATQITKNQVEKERYDELDDMLSVTSTTFLGLTVGCARCHTHKYDPIPTNDYYRMLSTFTTTVRSDFDINLDPEGYRKQKSAFDTDHAPLIGALQKYEKYDLLNRLKEWMKACSASGEPSIRAQWLTLEFSSVKSQGGATLTPQDDGSILAGGTNPDNDAYTLVARTGVRRITAIRLEALSHSSMVKGGPGRASVGNFALTNFTLTAKPASGGTAMPIKLIHPRASFEQKGLPVAAAIDGDAKTGWAVDPEFGKDHAAVFELEPTLDLNGPAELTFTLKFDNNTGHSIGRPRISVTASAEPVAFDAPARPEKVETILAGIASGARPQSDADMAVLLKWYRMKDPEWQRLNRRVAEHLAHEPKPKLQKTMICSEGVPAIRNHTQGGDFLDHTWFLKRGDPNQKGEVVAQSFLTVLMNAPNGEKRWQETPPAGWRTSYQRRSLANWITDVNHGAGSLLARVIVNRLWQHHIGRGIVATPSDFGVQGDLPTHPELLDWMAGELIRGGWRLKPMHKLIMMSAVYMQSSAQNQANAKLDPANRFCWRHTRQRLEAEVIRDSMLSVSGLLDSTMFGPGTLDESMKRRSIYFFVKRSRLIPTMILFDAPNALQSIGLRQTTTVAPQALMLINNVNMREYAAALAKRISPGESTPVAEAVRRGYLLTVGRAPAESELADDLAFLKQQAASYKSQDAVRLALTDLCQVLMSLNEFVYVD